MKKFIALLPLLMLPTYAAASDNMAACEAVMVEQVKENGEPTGAVMQTFAPAVDIIASIYDDEDGFLNEIDGRDVKAILCQRSSVVPSLRDFPILKTGIPFAISTDFEAVDSRSVTIFFKDGEFQHVFKGAELSENQQSKLIDVMEVFNLQPHDLKIKDAPPKKKSKKKKNEEISEKDVQDDTETNDELIENENIEAETETFDAQNIEEELGDIETSDLDDMQTDDIEASRQESKASTSNGSKE